MGAQHGGRAAGPRAPRGPEERRPGVSDGAPVRSAVVSALAMPWVFGPAPAVTAPRAGQVHSGRVRSVLDESELERERREWERARGGDRAALGALLARHGQRLYRSVLLPRLGSPTLAEEALGVTYVKAVERFEQFEWQGVGIYPWLRVVALRVALDQLRARKRELLFEPEHVERELDGAAREVRDADALERHDLAFARRRVEEVLGELNPRYARAIVLRVLEERARDECARALEVTPATFDVVLHRAMTALKKILAAKQEAE